MGYFDYHIPDVSELTFLSEELQEVYRQTSAMVARRMETLKAALELTGMQDNVFAATAKKLFDDVPEAFDRWSVESLAERVRMLYSPETPVYERLEFPNAITVVDSAFVRTKEWEALRHIGIGGSDSAVVMGISEWTDPLELYYDKIGRPELIQNDDNKQAIFDRGHILEDRVINSFCKLTGARRTHETRMFISKKYPHVTANPDEILIFPDGRVYVYEAKTTAKQNAYKWANDRVPAYYVTQTRQYPGVLDDDRIVGTYIGAHFIDDYTLAGDYVGSDFDEKQFVSREIERDAEKERELLEAEEKFWNEHIVPCFPPRSNATAEERLEIQRRYVTGMPDTSLPAEEWKLSDFADDIDEYIRLQDERKKLQAQVDGYKEAEQELQIKFIAALGSAAMATVKVDDDSYYEIKNAPRKKARSVDWEKLEVAYPDAYAACVETGAVGNPVFSLKAKKFKKKK